MAEERVKSKKRKRNEKRKLSAVNGPDKRAELSIEASQIAPAKTIARPEEQQENADGPQPSSGQEPLSQIPVSPSAITNSSEAHNKDGPVPEEPSAPDEANTDMSDDPEKLLKLQKAIGKYLRKNDIDRDDFEESVRASPVRTNGFYDFAKRYFARTSEHDFELLTERALFGSPVSRERQTIQSNGSNKRPSRQANLEEKESNRQANRAKRAARQQERLQTEGAHMPGPFTVEEKTLIASEVQNYRQDHDLTEPEFRDKMWDESIQGAKRKLFYERFSELLPARKPRSVRDYLRRAYMPYERGPYTEDDDKEILRLHKQLGADWKAIGKALGRYQNDVRDRYRNQLEMQEVESGVWSAEEIAKFQEILSTFKSRDDYNWSVIAQKMGTRSRPQCRDKYHRLENEKGASEKQQSPAKALRKKEPIDQAIKEGDRYYMLKRIRDSAATSMKEVEAENVLSAYDGVFSIKHMKRNLKTLLDAAHGDTFREKVAAIMKDYETAGVEKLLTTLVEE